MPHAVTKGTGLQALVLCGPGSSFPTFTANPDESPKALLPIANRPMVWYPLDFCSRAGITDITLICPPAAGDAIRAALRTNPFLTSLPAPAPSVLAPRGLDHTTGTAAILRLPEVRELVTADFVVLPCDLVCELGGHRLLQAWMVQAAALGDLLGQPDLGGGGGGHSGGLGVWYDTRTGLAAAVKSEETDFVATVPLGGRSLPPPPPSSASLLPHLERVVAAMPVDSLNDLTEDRGGYPTRQSLLRRHRAVRMRTTHRDAHIYVFPRWVMDLVQANPHMDSIGEDVVGWWAKAAWQRRLPEKLGMRQVLEAYGAERGGADGAGRADGHAHGGVPETEAGPGASAAAAESEAGAADGDATDGGGAGGGSDGGGGTAAADDGPEAEASGGGGGGGVDGGPAGVAMPPMLAYVHPSTAGTGTAPAPLIRRVDTSQLLLTVSLQLAKLASVEEVAAAAGVAADSAAAAALASPFAHAKTVAYPEGVKARTTVTRADSLVADNVTVEEKVTIKECVIGTNCTIHEGAKLHQCLLMEGVVVGKGCRLTRCILGRRSEIGAQSVLTDCEVQENLLVEPKTEEKDNNFMSSEGLEATAEELDEAMLDAAASEDDAGPA